MGTRWVWGDGGGGLKEGRDWGGSVGADGWKSQRWKWQLRWKKGLIALGQRAGGSSLFSPIRAAQGRKKVLLSASNDPLDNHTGTKRLYLTLIANPGPPISELHDSPALPHHLPAQSREPSLNGIYNHPSSVSTLIVILRLELCIKHLARLNRRPWLQCLLWALMTFPSQPDVAGVAAGSGRVYLPLTRDD